jgi:hypothetical protein
MKKFQILLLLFAVTAYLPAQEVVVLGTQGQEGELASPQDIREGPDGNIYIYDEADVFIKVYSPQGKFLRKMGGEGQGPGEIQRRDGVSFGFTRKGKLFFTEFLRGHRWITYLELSGELAGILKLDLPGSFGIPDAVALPDGGFLAELHVLGEPEQHKDYFFYKSPIRLLRLDAEGKIIANIRATEHPTRISYNPDGADSPLPFVPVFSWCLVRDETVIFSEGLDTMFEAIGLNGKPLGKIQTHLPEPEEVKGKDLDRWREQRKQFMMERNPGWWHRFGTVVEKYRKSIFKFLPMIDGLSATPEGRILVAGAWDIARNARDYWLVDVSGKMLAKLSPARGGITLTRSFVFTMASDPFGNVQVKGLKRSGSEKDDLLSSLRLLQR